MLSLDSIIDKLRTVYDSYEGIRIGVAGSYALDTATEESDIDVVVEGDSTRIDIAEKIKELFSIPVDVLWVSLLRQEDEELDIFAAKMGLPINKDSVYKTIMREAIWI